MSGTIILHCLAFPHRSPPCGLSAGQSRVSWAAIPSSSYGEFLMAKSIAWKMNCAVLIVTTAILGQGQTFKTLLKFNGTNGASPLNMNLVQGRDGNLYGTTGGDARNSWGTVFTIGPLGLTTLYNFYSRDGCADGYKPNAGLVLANDGSFYGTTREGGPNSAGTVFKITRQGNLTTLYNFCSMPNCVDGASPYSTLVQ